MSDRVIEMVPATLRATIAADLLPVRTLRAPVVRSLLVAPLGVLLLFAASLVFERRDLPSLGWAWSWGASALQLIAGMALVGAALQEAVPGRSWSVRALAWLLGTPTLLLVAVTLGSWYASPVRLHSLAWQIGALCLVSSAVSALPVTTLTAALALRALPTRPAVTGALAGVGGGLMADAGWRLFCEFSEPSHVLVAHLGGVAVAGVMGALLTRWLRDLENREIREIREKNLRNATLAETRSDLPDLLDLPVNPP